MNDVMIELFPALGGDCFLITIEEIDYRILIDGGFKKTFTSSLSAVLKNLGAAGKRIDLLVVTHVDNDHIMGIIELFRELQCGKIQIEICEIWYNGYRHLFSGAKQRLSSDQERRVMDEVRRLDVPAMEDCIRKDIGYAQGETLTGLLAGIWEKEWNRSFAGKAVFCRDTGVLVEIKRPHLSLMLLNPGFEQLRALEYKWNHFRRTKYLPMENGDSVMYEDCFERFLTYMDSSETNQSSISFLIMYTNKAGKNYNLLFLGDASAENCLIRLDGWKNIRFDCIKLPHHGSKNNITKCTLEQLRAEYLLFSTDGQKHGHPDWEVISAAASNTNCKRMVFNYESCKAVSRLKEVYPEKVIVTGRDGYCELRI